MPTNVSYTKSTASYSRTGTTGVITPTTITKTTNNEFVLDVGLSHYMRDRDIIFKVGGLKPNEFHYAFFDSFPISVLSSGCDIIKVKYNDSTFSESDFLYNGKPFEKIYFALYGNSIDINRYGTILHRCRDILYVTDVNCTVINNSDVIGSVSTASVSIDTYIKLNGPVRAATSDTVTLAENSFDYGSADNTVHAQFGNYANWQNSNSGLVIKIVKGTGAGQRRQITAYNRSTRVATLESFWDIIPDTTSVYSMSPLFTTMDGVLCGKMHIPNGQFLSGQKVFRVSSDVNNGSNAESFAEKTFSSQGLLKDIAPLQVSTLGFDYSTQAVSESFPSLTYVSDVNFNGSVSPGPSFTPVPTVTIPTPAVVVPSPPPVQPPPVTTNADRSTTTLTDTISIIGSGGTVSITKTGNFWQLDSAKGANDGAVACKSDSIVDPSTLYKFTVSLKRNPNFTGTRTVKLLLDRSVWNYSGGLPKVREAAAITLPPINTYEDVQWSPAYNHPAHFYIDRNEWLNSGKKTYHCDSYMWPTEATPSAMPDYITAPNDEWIVTFNDSDFNSDNVATKDLGVAFYHIWDPAVQTGNKIYRRIVSAGSTYSNPHGATVTSNLTINVNYTSNVETIPQTHHYVTSPTPPAPPVPANTPVYYVGAAWSSLGQDHWFVKNALSTGRTASTNRNSTWKVFRTYTGLTPGNYKFKLGFDDYGTVILNGVTIADNNITLGSFQTPIFVDFTLTSTSVNLEITVTDVKKSTGFAIELFDAAGTTSLWNLKSEAIVA